MSTAAVPAPTTIQGLNVRRSVLEDLALKTTCLAGELSVQDLAERMKISHSLAEELFFRLRREQLCEVTGMIGTVHRIQATSNGKARALELMALNQYVGPVPVALEDYISQVRWQSVRRLAVQPEDMQRAFQHLVIEKELLTRLGTSMISGRAIFLYGPPGNGKTTIAETMGTVFNRELIWLPYAIEVDGQIITVFDPHLHQPAAEQMAHGHDGRWLLCHRPRIIAGGELTLEMLDLQYNALTRYYTAPLHLKANNGVLIIDDFGRQLARPDQLLNRWVVPLDRQIDFMTMLGGKKVEVPFDVFVIFATNLDVGKLVDEAFLRRVQTKVHINFISHKQFQQIAENVCRELQIEYDAAIVGHMIAIIEKDLRQPLRACAPRDIFNQVIWEAKYHGINPKVDKEIAERACRNYYIAPAD